MSDESDFDGSHREPAPGLEDPRPGPAPIFLVGLRRSGVGLMAALLDAHPRLACGPEKGFFDLLGGARQRAVVDATGWPERAVEMLTSTRRDGAGSPLTAYGLDPDDVRLELASRKPSVSAVVEAVAATYAHGRGKDRWVERSPGHLLRVREIRELWPEARLIRMVRDPRGVAASLAALPDRPRSAVGAAYAWRAGDDPTWRFFERDPGAITVRYEDLVRDPAAEVTRLCDFMGEAFEPGMLGALEGGVAEKPVDAWREGLSATDQDRVALICADVMRRYGYEGGRQPTAEAWVKPLDAAFIADAEATLERAADAGVVFRMSAARWPAERGRLVLWGSEGQLRWGSGGRGASARAVTRWAGEMSRARLRGEPVLWVRRDTGRPPRRGLAERAGDALARRFAQVVEVDEVLPLVAGPRR